MDFSHQYLVRILHLGFGLILILNILLGVVGLSQLHRVRTSMTEIVEINNAKMEYANAMRDAIRLRALSTTKMLATDDYFERDAELIRFYEYATQYRIAKDKLTAMGLNPEEQRLHNELRQRTLIAQPLNRAAAELLVEGATEEEFRIAVIAARKEQEKVLQLLDQAIALEKKFSHEALTVSRQQSHLTMVVLMLAGVFILLLEAFIAKRVIRFVTDKNRDLELKNEELAYASIYADEATRAKTEFLANMSHEIRTPLTTIIGFSESLQHQDMSESDQRVAVDSIHRSSTHLYDIINDILDISKIEMGSIDYEILEVPPVRLVADVISIIGQKARNKGLALETQYDFPIPRTIKTDPTRLKQVLLNLCSNALKFTAKGKITITVQYQDEKILFVVEDTGIGMNQIQIANIFQVFQQGDSSTTRQYGGTGLGLAISRQIARDLGGDIFCRSQEGIGSVFIASVATGMEQPELVEEVTDIRLEAPPLETIATYQGRVLLAEDSPEIQALLSMVLKRAGLDFVVAQNGVQAVELAMQQPFDLILMDMNMPEMDGLQAIRQLRAHAYTKPIVVLSANALKQNRKASLDAGAQDYLVKPVDFDALHQILLRYLPKSSGQSRVKTKLEPKAMGEVIDDDVDPIDQEFEQLVREFARSLPQAIAAIKASNELDDLMALRGKAHQLKGAGGSFGFPELTQLAKAIMESADQQDRHQLGRLIDELDQLGHTILDKAAGL